MPGNHHGLPWVLCSALRLVSAGAVALWQTDWWWCAAGPHLVAACGGCMSYMMGTQQAHVA